LVDIAVDELTTISGQKAVATTSKKDISNFKLRKNMPIGARVTLRGVKMYEFLDRLISVPCLVYVTLKASMIKLLTAAGINAWYY
jgi:ribosomal protein L5